MSALHAWAWRSGTQVSPEDGETRSDRGWPGVPTVTLTTKTCEFASSAIVLVVDRPESLGALPTREKGSSICAASVAAARTAQTEAPRNIMA